MPTLAHDGGNIEIDDKGYLVRGTDWTPDVAAVLAREQGLDELTPDHWLIVDVLRRHQAEQGVPPMIRVLCKETGFALKRIYELFPQGPAKGACKVAGLPRPDSCV